MENGKKQQPKSNTMNSIGQDTKVLNGKRLTGDKHRKLLEGVDGERVQFKTHEPEQRTPVLKAETCPFQSALCCECEPPSSGTEVPSGVPQMVPHHFL